MQLNNITQQNSAAAEQLAASANALEDLSIKLNETTSFLIIDTVEEDEMTNLLDMIAKHNSEIAKIESRMHARKKQIVSAKSKPAARHKPATETPKHHEVKNAKGISIGMDGDNDKDYESF